MTGSRWYALAKRLAVESPSKGYAMAAVVVRGGTVLAHATNGARRGQHAERRAIHDRDVFGSTIYVARSDGGCSKPCPACRQALIEFGVSAVVYADWGGHVVMQLTADISG